MVEYRTAKSLKPAVAPKPAAGAPSAGPKRQHLKKHVVMKPVRLHD